ncbi:MAG TPA: NAD(P)H-dependent glycerol-3-phosphate dehydrogenase [Longimicrobiales bacterium]|nr:NAD(P)H-dependent glycerol-3-phosphate dehydrogenase [Longimicrobiales bacterium]
MSRGITVLGAGAWGTALASVLAKNGHDVTLWAREPEVVDSVNARHRNEIFLPEVALPPSLLATGDLGSAVRGAGLLVNVVPAQFVRSVWSGVAMDVDPRATVVSASKGIETETLERMDQVLGGILTPEVMSRFTVLSGPSFALEVAQEAPTLVVAASRDPSAAERVQGLFQNRFFRVYTNPDVVGVELGGALKNVIAVAAGVAAGLGFGHNTMAALVTRGLAEMTRLGVAMGARRETFAGLAGMGDLVLTCTGELSRNRTVGYRLGRGETLSDILGPMRTVAEGVKTVQAVQVLARRHGVEMPIAAEVHAMLTEGRPPREALDNLMSRAPRPEEWT